MMATATPIPMPAAAPALRLDSDFVPLLELAELELPVVLFNGYATSPAEISCAALGALNVSFVGSAQSIGAR